MAPGLIIQLTQTSSGYKYLALMVDALSGLIKMEKLQTKEAGPIAKFIHDRICCFIGGGYIRVNDNARELTGNLQSELCSLWGTSMRCITPHNPSANGIAEAAVKVPSQRFFLCTHRQK